MISVDLPNEQIYVSDPLLPVLMMRPQHVYFLGYVSKSKVSSIIYVGLDTYSA